MPEKFYRIYMDDSGNVAASTTNSPEIRYGGITAVILEASYLDAKFNPGFLNLVEKHFGKKEDGGPVTLHRRLLNKPPEQGPFSVLRDPAKRAAWDAECFSMYERAEYTVVSACVDKVAWYNKYTTWQGDFYQVLVQAVLERAYYFLRTRGQAEVNIETKEGDDQRIKAHYKDALAKGFTYIPGESLRSVFTSNEINILSKTANRPGLHLADLLAAPALQHIRNLGTGRHPIISPFVQQIADLLEAKKYYREQYRGPRGTGRVFRPTK